MLESSQATFIKQLGLCTNVWKVGTIMAALTQGLVLAHAVGAGSALRLHKRSS